MNIAVIPARGGSKRIPKKNIKNFCGKPLISWPIQIAIKSKLFDRVILSSEDAEIISIAKISSLPKIIPTDSNHLDGSGSPE